MQDAAASAIKSCHEVIKSVGEITCHMKLSALGIQPLADIYEMHV